MNIAILGSWLPQWNALYPRSKSSGSPPPPPPLARSAAAMMYAMGASDRWLRRSRLGPRGAGRAGTRIVMIRTVGMTVAASGNACHHESGVVLLAHARQLL